MRLLIAPLLATLLCTIGAAHAQRLPTLPEAFGRGTSGAGGVARGSDLMRVDIDLARYPDALCADATPAVFYVRSARAAQHREDWVVYLQGGGSCDNGQVCHDRWLGRDGNFGANKLSSAFAPAGGIKSGGIESPDARNPFAEWNQVFVYYCSSDGWAGQARDVRSVAVHEGAATEYRLHLLGARIVDAVFDTLRGGNGQLAYSDADGTRRAMPDLDSARTLLFAGSSAGGGGVRSNADRIGALLRSARPDCATGACPLRYAAVLDGSYGLASETLDHAGSRVCGPLASATCTYEQSTRRRWFDVLLGFRDGLADASCVDYHAPLGDEWRCADGAHVLEHHLQTAFFVRSDLQDSLVMGNTVEAGYSYQGVPLDRALYGLLEEGQLRALASIAARSEEARPASLLEPPGVFGPQCGDHETLRSNEPTFRRGIIGANGTRQTMLDSLSDWLAGRGPVSVVERFDASGPPASCGLR